ncbi:MAG: agmatine deiminase family protein, partial [candidate division NC10 bacterium]
FVQDEAMRERVRGMLERAEVDPARVRYHACGYADVWIRDYGPTFVESEDRGRLAMVRWTFNAWGGKYEELLADGRVFDAIEKGMGIPSMKPGIVMEGGSFDVNGKGALLTTEQCLLNKNRNPGLGRAGIEAKLGEFLGVEKVLWLKEGVAGDDTDGHVDDIARFIAPAACVCAVEDRAEDENYLPLKANYESLCRMSDQDGRPLEVLKLPMPDPVVNRAGRLPASYANFYIGNGVIMAPVFGCRQDEAALRVIEEAFPGRRVAPIPCRELVCGLGAVHCVTQQQPSTPVR